MNKPMLVPRIKLAISFKFNYTLLNAAVIPYSYYDYYPVH
jgi:hypothetical protein